jgi:hypothetical protein
MPLVKPVIIFLLGKLDSLKDVPRNESNTDIQNRI